MIKCLSLEQFYRIPDDLISNYDNIVLQYVEMLEHKRTQLRRNIGSLYFGTACWQLKHQIFEIISISDLLSVRFVDTKLICRRSLNHKHADSKHGNMKISLFCHFTTVRCQGNWNIFYRSEGSVYLWKMKTICADIQARHVIDHVIPEYLSFSTKMVRGILTSQVTQNRMGKRYHKYIVIQ